MMEFIKKDGFIACYFIDENDDEKVAGCLRLRKGVWEFHVANGAKLSFIHMSILTKKLGDLNGDVA